MKINTKKNEKQVKFERLFTYVKSIIEKTPDRFTTIPQKNLARILHLGLPTVREGLHYLVGCGKLIREELDNGKRENKKHKYTLPVPYIECILKRESLGSNMRLHGLGVWDVCGRLDLISNYLDSGWDVIPLVERGKRRLMKDEAWDSGYRGNKESIINFFAANPNLNVGMRMNGTTVVVDVDDASRFYPAIAGESFDTLTVSRGNQNKEHLYFCNTDLTRNYMHLMDSAVDVIVTNKLIVVLPPSIHESGELYRFTNLVEPLDFPLTIKNLLIEEKISNLRELPIAQKIPTGKKKVKRGYGFAIPETLTELQRQPFLFRYGRILRANGMSITNIAQELVNINAHHCKPPKTDAQMREIIKQVELGNNRPNYNMRKGA